MRRSDIQLLAIARQGDAAARCEAGRRYLTGARGFPRHVATGLEYLNHPSLRSIPEAACAIAEALSLEDILALRQTAALEAAAAAGSVAAQVKLGAWLCARRGMGPEAARWLAAAARAGHRGAQSAAAALEAATDASDALAEALRALSRQGELGGDSVAVIAARDALSEQDLSGLVRCVRAAVALAKAVTPEMAALVAGAVALAERTGAALQGFAVELVESSLEARANAGDRDAAYTLGRALCGIDCNGLRHGELVAGVNMRKGVALLLRAADAGCDAAWLHLYRTHADHRASVANAGMAMFFLEKAAVQGQVEAQRRLGALTLRAAASLGESEHAIQWLHRAAAQGDTHAARLMASLVLPVRGDESDAKLALQIVGRSDAWLAARLRVARDFGLTKLEGLSVDLVAGLRPWGLVVGRNPFIEQSRLSAPRAVPALNDAALDELRRAVALFEQAKRDASMFEGDFRQRSLRQRRLFARHVLDESMFFAEASSTKLESLRQGPKWAFHARQPLRMALAA